MRYFLINNVLFVTVCLTQCILLKLLSNSVISSESSPQTDKRSPILTNHLKKIITRCTLFRGSFSIKREREILTYLSGNISWTFYISIYTYIYMCVCRCVCVSVYKDRLVFTYINICIPQLSLCSIIYRL